MMPPKGASGMIIVLMGVTSSGKTTAGRLLAEATGFRFYDADDFHPAANIDKMRQGIALNDADRRPWLEALRDLVRHCLAERVDAVLACSALKESYRRYLRIDPQVRLFYLKADCRLIKQRLRQRQGHFMHPDLLASQFATLEEPRDAVWVDAALDPDAIVATVRRALQI